jgi:Tfp pilus assembly protein PilV
MFHKLYERFKQSGVRVSEVLMALLILLLVAIEVLALLEINARRLSKEVEIKMRQNRKP